MNPTLKPIYLFADSQLLFWRENGALFLQSVRDLIENQDPKAAYLGASNSDNPEFYSIFEAAMKSVGINDCRMISSAFSVEEALFVQDADLILLAGGEVERGWEVFDKNGLREAIVRRYYEGALLIGISAGAVQLGSLGWPSTGLSPNNLFDVFAFIPFIISAHDEMGGWEELKSAVQLGNGRFRGIGLPTGGGAIYHKDRSIEPIRHLLYEFSVQDEKAVE